jgi:magnesium transporter
VQAKTGIKVIQYSKETYHDETITNPSLLENFLTDESKFVWIDIDGTNCDLTNSYLSDFLRLHHVVRDELGQIEHRPKMEDFDDHIYLVLNMLNFDRKEKKVRSEQITFLLGKNYLISFQETGKDGDVFNQIRERIKNAKGRHRRFGIDYLLVSLIDTIVDHYFDILENVGDHIEMMESNILVNPSYQKLHEIYLLKRELILLRKSVWPLREVLNKLENENYDLIHDYSSAYIRITYEHSVQVIETLESYRDIIAGLLDIYLSSMSNKMNSIMKVLTIISTIFMPLTFIVGLYGMNFENIPEFKWHYGYYSVLGVCAVITLSMIVYFRRKQWL